MIIKKISISSFFVLIAFTAISQVFKSQGLGDQAYDQQNFIKAIEYYNIAIEKGDNSAYTYFRRAISKNFTSDFAGAVYDFTQAISKSPDDLNNYLGYVNRYSYLAQDTSEQGFSLEYKYYHAYAFRGFAKYKLSDLRGAIKDLTFYFEFEKNDPSPYLTRGLCYFALDKFEEAISDFSKSILLLEDNKTAYFYRGVCYLALEYKEKGCNDLSRAGELGSSDAYELIKKYCN